MTASERADPAVATRSFSFTRGINIAAPILLVALSFVLVGVGERFAPGFATIDNLLQLLKLSSFLGVAAIGQTLVMLTGGIDLSIAWVLTGSAAVFTSICDGKDANILPAAAAALSVGLATGLINGVGIVKLRISPIVMTLAMNNIMLGATLIYTGGTPRGSSRPAGSQPRHRLNRARAGHGHSVVCLGAITIVAIQIHARRPPAAQRRREPARQLSQRHRQRRVIIGAYMLCGLTTSVAGILFAAFSGPTFLGMGDQFVLPTIAAVVLGGTSMFGGRGGYGGTMAAVFFTTILSTVLVIGNISPGVRSIVFGAAVLIAIILAAISRAC